MTADTFDYGSIPYETWKQFAATVGADERHLKFAAAKFRGCTNTQAARESGFGAGGGTSTRSEGYRVARSNKVNQLLALAAAEAGGGYDGTLSKQEARSLLTAMARGSDPNVRIKSIELLNKMEKDEAANIKPEESLDETLAGCIAALPDHAMGAYLAMSSFNSTFGNIVNFPYLKECAPVVSKTYPTDWAKWRDANGPGRQWGIELIDRMAAGPLLEGDELKSAVKAKVLPTEIVGAQDAT